MSTPIQAPCSDMTSLVLICGGIAMIPIALFGPGMRFLGGYLQSGMTQPVLFAAVATLFFLGVRPPARSPATAESRPAKRDRF
jgi:hypothetical protein